MQQQEPMWYYKSCCVLWLFYPKKIYYRWQDPHIFSTDLLQWARIFSSHLNFVNSEQFWHTWWNFWGKIMEKPDMHVSVCHHEFWQSWGYLCWRWQQRVEVEGWLGGSTATVTWQGCVCPAQSSNPILSCYFWLMRNTDLIITKQFLDMHEVP